MENAAAPKEITIPLAATADPLLFGLRITKVVCSRTLKTQAGELYVGFSASTDQAGGIELRHARVAALRIGLDVVRAVYQRALLERVVQPEIALPIISDISGDYVVAIREELTKDPSGEGKGAP